MLDPGLLDEMTRLLDDRFGLDTLWVFGSGAAERLTPTSDLDLAALFRRRPSTGELLDARGDLTLLHPEGVDVIDLDAASPILAMQVLRYGRLVFDRNAPRRLRFAAATPGRYDDLKIVRRQAEALLVERMRLGRS